MTARYDPVRDVTVDCENRADRGIYDEETPSTVRHPNGSLMASFDRPFLGAVVREVIPLHIATQATNASQEAPAA